jgi:hypothetical protein
MGPAPLNGRSLSNTGEGFGPYYGPDLDLTGVECSVYLSRNYSMKPKFIMLTLRADKRSFFLNIAHLVHFNSKVEGETTLILTNNTNLTVINTPADIIGLITKD